MSKAVSITRRSGGGYTLNLTDQNGYSTVSYPSEIHYHGTADGIILFSDGLNMSSFYPPDAWTIQSVTGFATNAAVADALDAIGAGAEVIEEKNSAAILAKLADIETSVQASANTVSAVETIINDTNKANGEVTRAVISWGGSGYKTGSIHAVLNSASSEDTVTMKVYGSNNSLADNLSDNYWVDMSVDILGAATVEANDETVQDLYLVDLPTIINKLMVKITYADSGSGSSGSGSGDGANNSAVVIIQKSM